MPQSYLALFKREMRQRVDQMLEVHKRVKGNLDLLIEYIKEGKDLCSLCTHVNTPMTDEPCHSCHDCMDADERTRPAFNINYQQAYLDLPDWD